MSISLTFYVRIFCTKPNSKQRKAAQFTFVQKNMRIKCWWNWCLEEHEIRIVAHKQKVLGSNISQKYSRPCVHWPPSRDPKIAVVVERWLIFKVNLLFTMSNWTFDKWSLFRGGRSISLVWPAYKMINLNRLNCI